MRISWLLAASLLLPFPLWADTIVITPVNTISMRTGVISAGQSVFVAKGRITRIVSADDALLPGESPDTIDGENGWLIPGLAEMHAHVPSKRRGEQYARDILTLFLANGVTTIRGMLGEPWHLELRDLLENQAWRGPRLVTSGPSFNGNSVSSPQQADRRVRQQFAAGYDFLKIHPGLKPEEFTALATAARELVIPFAGHVSYAVGLDAALAQRQATIDHLDSYAEAMVPPGSALSNTAPSWFGLNLAAAMDPGKAKGLALATASAGVWNVPTQSLFETTSGFTPIADLLKRPGMDFLSEALKSSWQQSVVDIRNRSSDEERRNFLAARRSLIVALQDAGAGLLLGSDAPQIMNVPGFSVHQELAYMVAAGLTPLQALRAGTLNVAQFLGESEGGDLAPGSLADFLLLRQNPLEDIRATSEILGVMRAGTWYDRPVLDEMLKAVKERGI
jgi:imidazolonepropionase-like amidohydrolase